MKRFLVSGAILKNRLFLLLLLVSYGYKACSQTYQREDIEIVDNGESGTLFNRMATDDRGFLWYNTYNAFVMRYGNSDLQLSTGPDELRETNIVSRSNGNLFCLSDTGIFRINPESKETTSIPNTFSNGEKPKLISLVEDSKGVLWIGTSDNFVIKLLPGGRHEKILLDDTIHVPEGEDPGLSRFSLYTERSVKDYGVLLRRGRKLYLLENDSIVPLMDLSDSQNFKYTGINRPLWNGNGGDGLLITDDGVLFDKGRSGTYHFNGIPLRYQYAERIDAHIIDLPFEESQAISKETNPITGKIADLMTLSDDGKALLLHKFTGIGETIELKEVEAIRFKDYIEDIHIDGNDVIHVSHFNTISKIKFIDPGFRTYLDGQGTDPDSSHLSTRDIIELENGNLLVASYSGIFEIDVTGKNNPVNLFPDIPYIRRFIKMNDSLIVALGENPMIHLLDMPKRKRVSFVSQVNTHFQDAVKIDDSTIYVGGRHGLFSLDVPTGRVARLPQILDTLPSGPLFVKHLNLINGTLYIGTEGQGLYTHDLSSGRKEQYNLGGTGTDPSVSGNTVYCTFRDSRDRIWIGADNGLAKIGASGDPPLLLGQTRGQKVVGILEQDGNIWFSTYNGLYRTKPGQSAIFSYFTQDGLPNNEFNQNSYGETRDGHLIFGGVNGLVSFKNIGADYGDYRPKLYPISYETFDLAEDRTKTLYSLGAKDTIALSHDNNYLRLNFSIDDHLFADNNTYYYQLGDGPSEWIDLGSQDHLALNLIPPGDYDLKIKAQNSKGVEASNILVYHLRVSEIFYRTTFFKYTVLISAFFLMILLGGWYFKRKQDHLKHRLSSLQLERKVLRSQMYPHFLFNALNSLVHKDYDRDALKGQILRVSGLMRKTLESSRYDFISVKDELDYIESYVSHENEHRDVEISYRTIWDCDENTVDLPSMMVQPIVENCMKHAFDDTIQNPVITLELERYNEYLKVTIMDNGKGPGKTSGKNGSQALAIARERIDVWNKLGRTDRFKIAIEDRKAKDPSISGTRVLLVLPYKTSLANTSGGQGLR